MAKSKERVKAKVFGPVEFGGELGYGVLLGKGVQYEAMFPEPVAKRLAELENRLVPPRDWEHAKEILEREGFDLDPPPSHDSR